MRKSLSILFVLLFMLQSTSKLWIMASFYAQRDYIIENLCENRFEPMTMCGGVCFLDKQLAENEKEEQNSQNFNEKEVQFFCPEVGSYALNQSLLIPISHHKPSYTSAYNIGYIHGIFHPPKA
ncbi:hypothetical protein Q4534_00665 [Cyclobacterium sp. 1_MG-2023]|uniref:hypothetical protein n=1 Tax=Cyclobacterium sp. 1_MG-2023 TaxID=3062681 RepID=UPI0026E3DBF3|nr:hypothetical protein [Cyclobacterium sp. 1_MG-2023]MDO6435890.1 hypothetical protein [Cyclobacterium sp. 1_MG-2023]